MKNKKATLKLKDLNSIFSFENWIRSAIKQVADSEDYKGGRILNYEEDKHIPPGHLHKYLGHIERKLESLVGNNSLEWTDKIENIKKAIEEKL